MVKLLLDYWLIMAILLGMGFMLGEPLPKGDIFLYNLFGLMIEPNRTYICVTFGWYFGFYIMIILFLLPIHGWIDKSRHDFFVLLLIAALFLLQKVGGNIKTVSDFVKWAPLFSIGYYVSKYEILSKIGERIETGNKKAVLSCVVLVLVFGAKCLTGGNPGGFNMYIVYTPPFVIALFYIVDYMEKSNNQILKGIIWTLETLGKNSMNLWLLHGIFFTPKGSLQFVAYWPKYGILIVIWAFIILMPFAFVLDKIQRRIKHLVRL